MNDYITAKVNETIEQFPNGLVHEAHQSCGNIHIWLDGEYDDYEEFMEELRGNLPVTHDFDNNIVTDKKLPTFGKCHIRVRRVKSSSTLKHYFRIISNDSEEYADGYVEDGKVVYKDPLFEVYFSNEYPHEGELKDHLEENEFDETLWVQGFSPNEFGIYPFEKFTFIVNPQGVDEALLNTMIHFRVEDMVSIEQLPRKSIQDFLEEVFLNQWVKYTKISPFMGVVHHAISNRILRVHFGDFEIASAVESLIYRMDIDYEDKWQNRSGF